MNISNVITIIGILIAVFAAISERQREFILLKFSRWHFIWIIIVFVYLNFLLGYEWLSHKIGWLDYFEIKDWSLPANTWAYILSVIGLIWILWRVFSSKAKFPFSNATRLIDYYKKLINNNLPLLVELIEKYHLSDIEIYLRAISNIQIEKSGLPQVDNQKYEEQYNQRVNTKALKYADRIYHQILLNDSFIDGSSNLNPEIHYRVIQELKSSSVRCDELVNRFLKNLLIEKNVQLFREVRNNINLDEVNAYRIEKERPLLFALFNDVRVAYSNNSWISIENQAIREIQEEAHKKINPLGDRKIDPEDDILWSYRIYIAIWYFDIMVREGIRQQVKFLKWMNSYSTFIELIFENMDELISEDSNKNRETLSYKMIEEIISKQTDWLEVTLNLDRKNYIDSICTSIGFSLFQIAKTKKIRSEDKCELFSYVFDQIVDTEMSIHEDHDREEISELIVEKGIDMLLKPFEYFKYDLNKANGQEYVGALRVLRNKINLNDYDPYAFKRVHVFINRLKQTYDIQ